MVLLTRRWGHAAGSTRIGAKTDMNLFDFTRSAVMISALSLSLVSFDASAAETWLDYGVMPDGSIYSWRTDLTTTVRPGVYRVWSLGLYGKPRPVPTAGTSIDSLAKSVLTTQRITCATKEIQTMKMTYFDVADQVIASNDEPQPVENTRPGTVGARLVESVCSTLGSPSGKARR